MKNKNQHSETSSEIKSFAIYCAYFLTVLSVPEGGIL